VGDGKRQRTAFLAVRLRPDEDRDLRKRADEFGCTPAELVRAVMFDYAPQTLRCAPGHKGCTPAHRDLVANYRVERHRQEVEFEGMTGGHAADAEFLKAKGHKLTTFFDWLRAHTTPEEPHG
jgi:hypothetical protein